MYDTRSPHEPSSARHHRCLVSRLTGGEQVGARLAREWQRLRVDPAAVEQAERWQIVDGPVHDLDQVLAAVGFGTARSAQADRRLTKLVELAATDDLAGRVVIQRLMPGLVSRAARRRGLGRTADELDELIGAAWISIRTYNAARRPGCLAAALLADAGHRAFRSAERRRWIDERPTDLSDTGPAAEREPHPAEELADLFRAARSAGVSEQDLDILRRLLDNPRMADAATALNVTSRTIRNRRDRVTTRLREVALTT